MVTVGFFASSVEEWIERKLHGDWMADIPYITGGRLTPEMMDAQGTSADVPAAE
jgi:hypothetical protein